MTIEQAGRKAAVRATYNQEVMFVVRTPLLAGGMDVLDTQELNETQTHDDVVLIVGPPALLTFT